MSLAETITRALGGNWHGKYGLIPGPGHSPKDRSVSVRDSNTLPDGVVETSGTPTTCLVGDYPPSCTP